MFFTNAFSVQNAKSRLSYLEALAVTMKHAFPNSEAGFTRIYILIFGGLLIWDLLRTRGIGSSLSWNIYFLNQTFLAAPALINSISFQVMCMLVTYNELLFCNNSDHLMNYLLRRTCCFHGCASMDWILRKKKITAVMEIALWFDLCERLRLFISCLRQLVKFYAESFLWILDWFFLLLSVILSLSLFFLLFYECPNILGFNISGASDCTF